MIRSFASLLFFLLVLGVGARAQFGSFSDVPIEIESEQTRFDGGTAYADGSVRIRYNDVVIECDHATYNPETRDVLLEGNVRLFRSGQLFTAERALYNLETKIFNGAEIRGDQTPFRFATESLSTLGANAYLAKGAIFTTSDNSKPDYYLRAKSVRIYPKDRVIFRDVTVVVGRTPVFWFPYIYQALDQEQGFTITPGYNSVWGAHLLGQYTFPLSETMSGKLRLDLLADRGIGVGFDTIWQSGKDARNWGRFRSYYIDDSKPDLNRTGNAREDVDTARYRIQFQSRAYLTDDIYASIDINKLSDARFLQDWEPGEFRRNPNPDNVVALTKWDEDYTVTFTARKNLNEADFDMTERLPDLALDLKRRPIFGKSGVFYEGESSLAYLRRNFADGSLFEDYDTWRADTFHQLLWPKTVGGWLSVIPRVGVRGTYYGDTGRYVDEVKTEEFETEELDEMGNVVKTETNQVSSVERRLREGSGVFRPVVNAGLELSFKISKPYEQVQSRMWGLDGMRHIVQPYLNAAYTYAGEDPLDILQFDRRNPSSRPPPIDYPQFNSIDSIDTGTVIRLGMRNRLQTRRDDRTINWFEADTFLDIRPDVPDYGILGPTVSGSFETEAGARRAIARNRSLNMADDGTFSNLHNRFRWIPLPWVSLTLDSQIPLLDDGFTEVNTQVAFMPNRDVQVNLGHRFIDGNIFFQDSNLITFGAHWRMNDNWSFSFRDAYEITDGVLESQRYEVHRDLSSWIASLGFLVRDNGGVNDIGFVLTFTLKDLPNLRLPLNFDPEGFGDSDGSSGRSR